MAPEATFVIGSGPTGVACARALADQGRSVTIIDTGLRLEPEREQARAALGDREPDSWSPGELAFLRASLAPGGVPMKLAYGSDFAYRQAPSSTSLLDSSLAVQGSHAVGGLSNVWGSAILPFRQADMGDWPIGADELADGYRAVLRFMPSAAQVDDLAELFPLHAERFTPLPPSRQATRLLQVLARNRAKLNRSNVFFGGSRLAVDASQARASRSCASCGLCLHGCPRRLIYSSEQSLGELQARHGVRYLPGLTVISVEEGPDGVRIRAHDSSGKAQTLTGGRAFLAAGTINTTAILLRSLGLYDQQVLLKDSQYFLLPALQLGATSGVMEEPLHTLCQAFIEIIEPAISPYTVHLQLYTYNDLFRSLLDDRLGAFGRLVPKQAILGRLLLFQSYLHSSHSGAIAATLQRRGSSDALNLKPVLNPDTKRRVAKVVRKLIRLVPATQVVPIKPLLELTEPGRGFHIGGSFPMARKPGPGHSDRWGRPFGLSRIHAVDATLFPSIPATTITLTAMANAYRIGAGSAAGYEEEAA